MKRILLIACAAIASMAVRAQDIIVTKDAKKIDAKILEVSKSEIKYKDWDNQEGPTFILEVADINSIIYSNGKVTVYNQQAEPQKSEIDATDKQSEAKTVQEQFVQEEIKPEVVVDFEIMGTSDPFMYRFPNLSSGATDFRWDFGDGTFSFAKDEAMKAYKKAGTYIITLTANVGSQKYEQRKTLIVGKGNRKAQDKEEHEPMLEQAQKSGEQLGKAIGQLIAVENSYVVEIQNNTKYPYRINLDGHILGVVNGYKTERFVVSVNIYGRMQAVQTSGYVFSPTIKEYRVPPQQKKALYRAVIK